MRRKYSDQPIFMRHSIHFIYSCELWEYFVDFRRRYNTHSFMRTWALLSTAFSGGIPNILYILANFDFVHVMQQYHCPCFRHTWVLMSTIVSGGICKYFIYCCELSEYLVDFRRQYATPLPQEARVLSSTIFSFAIPYILYIIANFENISSILGDTI